MLYAFVASLSSLTLLLLLNAILIAGGLLAWWVGSLTLGRGCSDEDRTTIWSFAAKGLFSFVIFLLSFSFGKVFANYYEASASVHREAALIEQLRNLVAVDPEVDGPEVLDDLRRYAEAVATKDWEGLGRPVPELSDEALAHLLEIRREQFAIARTSGSSVSDDFIGAWNDLEDLRHEREEAASELAPTVLWVVVTGMLLVACVLSGVHRPTTRTMIGAAIYLGTFATVMWLIGELDRPFDGFCQASRLPLERLLAEPWTP